jgi:hypothetical protein
MIAVFVAVREHGRKVFIRHVDAHLLRGPAPTAKSYLHAKRVSQ